MKSLLTICSLLLLTLASYWFLNGLEKELDGSVSDNATRKIATAYQVSAKYFDINNQLQYTLSSDEVIEYSNHSGTKFLQPNMQAFDSKQHLEWQATSDMATLSGDRKQATLAQNVLIVQEPNSERPIHVTGEIFNYDADKNTVRSDKPVIIKDGIIQQVADRFELNTLSEKINFSHGIRASYQPITQ